MNIRALFLGAALCLLAAGARAATGETLLTEVYRDDNITVGAGIRELENRIIHFGDVLPLLVKVTYDSARVRLVEWGPEFFNTAWPESEGAFLQDLGVSAGNGQGSNEVSTATYRFQILGCPQNEVLCRGTRQYQIPEFTLEYQLLDEAGNEADTASAQFTPWPASLMVASAIPLGEEGELNPFPVYFPTGAYPSPLAGEDRSEAFAGLLAGGLFLLLGGIMMSPLSFFKRGRFAPQVKPRWQDILEQIEAGEYQGDKAFLDALRKSLVWYCVDELKIDPFYWIKHEEEVSKDKQKSSGENLGFRELFIHLLHSPSGENEALLKRYQDLLAEAPRG